MDKPSVDQIKQIVRNVTENDDPVLHKATIEKYFTPTVSFLHPIVNVKSAPHSIDTFKQVYAVYKALTSKVEIEFLHVTLDADNTRAVVELEESLNFALLPFSFTRIHGVRFVTILDLVRDKQDGKYYISRQYDVIPIDSAIRNLPFGFVYGWWQSICTLTGSVVGSGVQMSGLWGTA